LKLLRDGGGILSSQSAIVKINIPVRQRVAGSLDNTRQR